MGAIDVLGLFLLTAGNVGVNLRTRREGTGVDDAASGAAVAAGVGVFNFFAASVMRRRVVVVSVWRPPPRELALLMGMLFYRCYIKN